MRFVFYFEDTGHNFSLQQLKDGDLGVGGQISTFRILFWLAREGHDVIILNHYDQDVVAGMTAIRLASYKDIPDVVKNISGADIFIFKNHSDAYKLASLSIPLIKAKVMWSGNPIPTQWLLRFNKRLLNKFVFVSNSHREGYRCYPYFRRIEVARTGVDIDLIDETPFMERKDNLVVFIGAPLMSKGFHNLLLAWPHVLKARPETRLRILGSAALHDTKTRMGWTKVLEPDLETRYLDPIVGPGKRLERGNIEFAGTLPIKEVFRELKQANVAIVNCNWDGSVETYCRSAVESQACGTPVVGAARGSLPDVVQHNRTGLLIAKPNPKELASAIIYLLNNKDVRDRFGREGEKWARSIGNYQALVSDWVEIAERAINNKSALAQRNIKGDILRWSGYGMARIIASRLIHGAV